MVILTGVLAGNLMRIAVAGEEADDLLRASPQPYRFIERVKLLAALLMLGLAYLRKREIEETRRA